MSELTKFSDHTKVAFLGSGNMAGAIVRGLIADGHQKDCVLVTDRSGKSGPALAKETGCTYVAETKELIAQAQILILACKPHQVADLLAPLQQEIKDSAPLVVSILAGTSCEKLAKSLPDGYSSLVRVMPNVGAALGQSTTAVATQSATENEVQAVADLFSAVGSVSVIDEGNFATFTAMAGCSPAWFAASVEALARAGVANGLSAATAMKAAAEAMRASADLLLAEEDLPLAGAEVIRRVCSPGGTTVAGLQAAESAGLRHVWAAAVEAAIARDTTLGAS
ncbi:pyrroline-5-carboxylate reductase [Boudabousia tangfeifanii]|uniref:Pyrroline-5-carboxylate reductase n=1 Tax=Boudabousia tangfeifanii TaxID=1912795 RepID=A0A1D9MKW8_9ACTO|nr:pyrroline-5-carboxylate reductase [Boudabousia tangfeifanii]AOZ72932.1 pyrroline-5-carboxylate reductase [Boudabousia tangfeifanii]